MEYYHAWLRGRQTKNARGAASGIPGTAISKPLSRRSRTIGQGAPAVSQRAVRVSVIMLISMKQIGHGKRLFNHRASFKFEVSSGKQGRPAAPVLLASSYVRPDARSNVTCAKRSQFGAPDPQERRKITPYGVTTNGR